MSYKEIIDNVSNIEDLDNTTILKVLEKFSKTIEDFAIEQSGLNNLVNVEFIPSDNNTTYTGDSVDYLGTLKLTLSDNIIVNKPCNIKFNIKSSNTIVVDVDEFNNSLELHLDNSVVTTLDFAESERQKSETDGAIVHKKEIADVEHIETIYDMSSSDESINLGYTGGIQPETTISNLALSKYKTLRIWFSNYGYLQYQGFLTLRIEGNGHREIQSTVWNSNYQIDVNKLDDTSSLTNNSSANCIIGRIEGVY